MNIARLLEKIFFPSNVIIISLIFLLYFNYAQLTPISILVYGLSIVGLPIAIYVMQRKTRRKYRGGIIAVVVSLIVFYLLSILFPNIREVNYAFFGVMTLQILGIIIFLIRFKWRISLHVSILTNCITVLSLIDYRFLVLMILIPIVAWSRVRLKVHTIMQVVFGFIVGLLIPILVYFMI